MRSCERWKNATGLGLQSDDRAKKSELVSCSALIQQRINLPGGWFKPVASASLRQQALSSSPTILC
jgi:hypothetical protein